MRNFISPFLFIIILITSCAHHTKCPTYANSGTSKGKRKASCPTYASSNISSNRVSKKKRSCPTYANSGSSNRSGSSKKKSCPTYANSGSSGGTTATKKKSCPTYASSSASHNKNNKAGLAPWTKKAKEQDKKKATSGLLPNQQ